MSNPVGDEPITCASCEYRYSRSQLNCPMCGTAAPAVESIQPPSAVPNEFSGADYQSRPSVSDSQQSPPHPGLRRLVPIVVVSTVLMVVLSVFYEVHKRNLAKESGSADLTAILAQPKVRNADQRHIARNPVRRVQHVIPAKLGTAQTPDTAKEDDPVELWKGVKRGDVSAEVALANLYLQGKSVPQSCEQAHMLLQTASTKGSKAADTLLKSNYAERCE